MATRKETDLWLLERLVPGAGVNNLSVTFDVDGRLEPAALSRALTLVVRRQEILRTVFRAGDGELDKSVLAPEAVEISVSGVPVGAGEAGTAVQEFVAAPFTLDGSLLVRGVVFLPEDGGCTVSVALHHLVFDAMSTVSFLGELLSALADPDGYDTTPVAAAVEPEPAAESVEFWREQLRGFKGGAEGGGLWFGNPPSDTPDLAGESTWYTLSRPARDVVRRLCRELRAPEAVILLSAYCLLLSRHGAGKDLVVGSPVSVRPAGHEAAIGYHVNVLPLRVRIDSTKPFKRLVNRVRSVFLEGIGHSGVPAERVLDEVREAEAGASWRNSLCTHLFNYVPGGTSGDFQVAGFPARMREVENGFSKFDLEFFFMPGPAAEPGGEEELRIRAVFRTQVFSPTEVGLLLARYDALLVRLGEELASPVGELSVWSDADRAAVAGGHRHGLPSALPCSPAVAQFSSYDPGEWSAVRALVSAPDGGELPVRVRGELCLAEADGTVRHTGELARWLPDGRLELLGRLDRQVTVQGLTFGLDEVDAVLLAHAEVAGAASVAVGGRVVSFVAPAGGAAPAEGLAERLLKQIRVSLPGPAEPDRVVVVDALPSVGGRPDLEGLRLRAEAQVRGAVPAEEAPVDTEELTDQLLALWREFLKREDLKAGSGFFASGGHSLLGVQLLQRIKRTTDVKVRIRLADLFAHPTPRALAGFIAERSE
ncbi:condensation domain-containing protein [Streptomyces sp. L2]|uniref:condensation domain-containing protein n=1 Tax=Streptomyces sp. L2 TaxID=2162665 RepID=UPI0013E97CC6|nr:condensation domain-containing protein [Streptomyces sp. L2]